MMELPELIKYDKTEFRYICMCTSSCIVQCITSYII